MPPPSVNTSTPSAEPARLPVSRTPARYITAGKASASRPLLSTSADVSDVPSGTKDAASRSARNG